METYSIKQNKLLIFKEQILNEIQMKILKEILNKGFYKIKFSDKESFLNNEEYKQVQSLIQIDILRENYINNEYIIVMNPKVTNSLKEI